MLRACGPSDGGLRSTSAPTVARIRQFVYPLKAEDHRAQDIGGARIQYWENKIEAPTSVRKLPPLDDFPGCALCPRRRAPPRSVRAGTRRLSSSRLKRASMRSSSATAGSKSGPASTPTAPRGALKLPQRLLSTRERSLGSQEAPSEASQLCHGPGRPPCRARGFPTRRLEEEREANIQAPQPIVQRAPLQRREQDLQLTKYVNTRQMVTLGQAANGEMTGVYYCKVLATAACAIPATAHARPPATVALLSTISLQSQYDLATAPPPPRRPAATPPRGYPARCASATCETAPTTCCTLTGRSTTECSG